MALRTTPDTYILESKILAKFPRLRRIMDRFLLGSTGAEIWSAFSFIVNGTTILLPGRPPSGLAIRIITLGFHPAVILFLILVGVLHFVSLGMKLSQVAIAIRKVCSGLELVAWSAVLVDMIEFGMVGSAMTSGILYLMLFIAVVRRKYIA